MRKTKSFIIVLTAIVMLAGIGLQVQLNRETAHAAVNSIYLTPKNVTTSTGSNFNVEVWSNTEQPVNAVRLWLTFGAGLTIVGESPSGSRFPNDLGGDGIKTQGKYEIERSNPNGSMQGNLFITTITFRANTPGTHAVSISKTDPERSYLINYPNGTNLANVWQGGTYTVNAPPVDPPPPDKPTKPTKDDRQIITSKPKAKVKTPQSQPTASGLQISDFEITDIAYRSAVVSWKTNKPANSIVKFGENPDELTNELRDEGQKTDHRIVVEGENVKAGHFYYINIASSDGSEPAQLDGEFSTSAIPVLIKVVDTEGKPVEDASAYTESAEGKTNADGEATLDLPEGEITISAVKDDYYGEIEANILLPEEDSGMQEVIVNLSVLTSSDGGGSGSSSVIWLYIILFLILLGLGIWGFILWKRRRQTDDGYYGDPLVNSYPTTPVEAGQEDPSNYATLSDPSLNPTPEQDYVPHYQSLPDMLKTETPQEPLSKFETEPEDMFEKANHSSEDQPTIDNPFADKISGNQADFPAQPASETGLADSFNDKTAGNSLDNFSDTSQDFSLDTPADTSLDKLDKDSAADATQSDDGTLIIDHEK